MDVYIERWRRAQRLMMLQGIDALLLAPSSDFYYATGYSAKATERFTALLLLQSGEPRLILPAFELSRLNVEFRRVVACHTWGETQDPLALITGMIPPRATAGVGDQTWAVFLLGLRERLPLVEWVPGGRVMTPLRLIKDAEEVRLLREAQQIAERVMRDLYQRGLAGKTERLVAAELGQLRQAAGLDIAGSAGSVGSGPNGASPHHLNSDRVIRPGDAVVIDFGGGHAGYRADLTRTPHVGPAPSEFREIYQAVLEANAAAFSAVRPGVSCESIDRAGRQRIEAAGHGEYFITRLGHGIGLDGHEPPYIVEGNSLPLAVDMTFTDEPGIYLPEQFGVRIEDVVRVTGDGAERLTHFSRDLEEID